MAAPTTLKQLAEQRRDRLAAARTDALQDLTDAQDKLAGNPAKLIIGARPSHQQAVKKYAELAATVSATKEAMAAAAMPADAEALLTTLRGLLVELRGQRATVLAGERALDEAEQEVKRLVASIRELSNQLPTAEQELSAATTRQARHQARVAALAAEPLSSLKTAAQTALGDQSFTDAKDRVENDLPTKLRTRAIARGTAEHDRLHRALAAFTGAQDLLDSHNETAAGTAGKVSKLQTALLRAEEQLADYVLHAKDRFDSAVSQLTAIVASPQLTTAEQEQITDSSLETDREAAADAEKARDDALTEVELKATALATKRVEVEAGDIDAEVDSDPAVIDLANQLQTAKTTLTAAEASFTTEMRQVLDRWEAAVPEPIWANLVSFGQAEATLKSLKTPSPTPTAMKTAVTNAESALLAALLEQDKNQRTSEHLSTTINSYRHALELSRGQQARRTHSAVAGDR